MSITELGHGSIDLDEAARQLATARAEVDAAENVLRAVLGATGGIAGDR
jgi:outer membrane protein TolC